MKLTFLGFLAIAILATISCQKDNGEMTDGQLIAAIQKATNKQNIEITELPSASRNILDQEYADNNIDGAKLAPELGYEVDMIRLSGPKASEFINAYFNLSGRELKGDKGGKGDKGDKGDGDKRDCFELVYPVTYIMPDGTEITVNSKDDAGWAEIKEWYAAHPDVKKRPAIQFPVDIKWKNGTVITINNREEMRQARKRCKGDGDKRDCFKLVYPVTYIMPDGTEIIVYRDTEDGWAEVKAWYAAHPDVKKRPAIKFPVDIEWRNGKIITINNREGMHRAKRRCKGDGGDKERCFEFIYPVTYIMPDGTEITVNGEDDGGWAEIRAWYVAHPDVKKRPEFKFPIDIKYKDNDAIKTINNREELRRAYEECKDKD
ncbi:MAG TPA: hypothetical protein QF480_08565 [Bacteroidales bacterium]|jgi:hypothetical protein|nr:hypothetical protein [Bacteroidales bacterium]